MFLSGALALIPVSGEMLLQLYVPFAAPAPSYERKDIVDCNADQAAQRITENIVKLTVADIEEKLRKLDHYGDERRHKEDERVLGVEPSQKRAERNEEPDVVENFHSETDILKKELIGPERSEDQMPGPRRAIQRHVENERQVEQQKEPAHPLFVKGGDHAQRNSEEDNGRVGSVQKPTQMPAHEPYEIE